MTRDEATKRLIGRTIVGVHWDDDAKDRGYSSGIAALDLNDGTRVDIGPVDDGSEVWVELSEP